MINDARQSWLIRKQTRPTDWPAWVFALMLLVSAVAALAIFAIAAGAKIQSRGVSRGGTGRRLPDL